MNFGMAVLTGDTIEINIPDDAALSEICFGVRRANRTDTLTMSVSAGSEVLITKKKLVTKEEKEYQAEASHFTDVVSISIDSTTAQIQDKKISVFSSRNKPLKIIEPLFLFHR